MTDRLHALRTQIARLERDFDRKQEEADAIDRQIGALMKQEQAEVAAIDAEAARIAANIPEVLPGQISIDDVLRSVVR